MLPFPLIRQPSRCTPSLVSGPSSPTPPNLISDLDPQFFFCCIAHIFLSRGYHQWFPSTSWIGLSSPLWHKLTPSHLPTIFYHLKSFYLSQTYLELPLTFCSNLVPAVVFCLSLIYSVAPNPAWGPHSLDHPQSTVMTSSSTLLFVIVNLLLTHISLNCHLLVFPLIYVLVYNFSFFQLSTDCKQCESMNSCTSLHLLP